MNLNVSNGLRLLGVLAILFAAIVQFGWITSTVQPVAALIVGVILLILSGVL